MPSQIIDFANRENSLFEIKYEDAYLQRVPALRAFWDLEKTKKSCQWDCSKSPTNAKIPHLHVNKPKTVVVETVLVIFV